MGTYVVLHTDGTQTRVPGGKELELSKLYELIGCELVECTPVKFEGRKRDCWLDEEGLLKQTPIMANGTVVGYETVINPQLRELSAAYWKMPIDRIQPFAGIGVIWLPETKTKKEATIGCVNCGAPTHPYSDHCTPCLNKLPKG